MNSNKFDLKILQLVNQERTSRGLNRLSLNSQLDKQANLYTNVMVQNDKLSHYLPRNYPKSYKGRGAGENIAAGQTTPEKVMQGWMNSPGHRKNILKPGIDQIGIGYAKAPDNKPYNQGNTDGKDYDIYWTQLFGKAYVPFNNQSFDQKVLKLANRERANAGLDSLSIDKQLDQAANWHTNDMTKADQLGGGNFYGVLSATGYDGRARVQYGAGYETPEDFVNISRNIILDSNATHLGFGSRNEPDDNSGDADTYWTIAVGTEF